MSNKIKATAFEVLQKKLDAMTEGAKEYLRNKIDEALEEMWNLEKRVDSIIEGLEKKAKERNDY